MIAKNIVRGKGSNGAPYLRIVNELNESITFFHGPDLEVKIEIGDTFDCMLEKKGQYLNGAGLKVVSTITNHPILKPPNPPVPVPISIPTPIQQPSHPDAYLEAVRENTKELIKLNAFFTRIFGGVNN